MWEFVAANRLNWSPGHMGKGNIYADEGIHTWNVDEHLMPHHQMVADDIGQRPRFLFHITPDGGVHDAGLGFNNQLPHSDEHLVAQVCNSDPRLRDATQENHEDIPELEPRVEDEEGYGHAHKMIGAIRLADEPVQVEPEVDLTNPDSKSVGNNGANPLAELKAWVDSFGNPTEGVQPLTPHHDDESDFLQQPIAPASIGPHIDPPSHPYEPYDWAKDASAGGPCEYCGLDHPPTEDCPLADSKIEFDRAERNWYDRVWDQSGSPTKFPSQPMHWRHDHAPDVSAS